LVNNHMNRLAEAGRRAEALTARQAVVDLYPRQAERSSLFGGA
jgi:hypothetical protein